MKLIVILSLLIGASLLVETEANWWKKTFKPVGQRLMDMFSLIPSVKKKKPTIYSVRGYLRHKDSGLYVNIDKDDFWIRLQPGKSRKAYLINYKDSNRLYAPDYNLCANKFGSNLNQAKCVKPWRKNAGYTEKFSMNMNEQGNSFQFKHLDSNKCVHPSGRKGKPVKPGNLLRLTRDCGPKSYSFIFEEIKWKDEVDPDARKKRDSSYRHSKRRALSHGHFKRNAFSRGRNRRSGLQ